MTTHFQKAAVVAKLLISMEALQAAQAAAQTAGDEKTWKTLHEQWMEQSRILQTYVK